MKLLDSNILIYSAGPQFTHLKKLVSDPDNFVSAISKVEVLGFNGLSAQEQTYFNSIFQILQVLEVDEQTIEKAIEIRKKKRIKLGDALIAATALVHDLELNTRNVGDFNNINGLKLANPM